MSDPFAPKPCEDCGKVLPYKTIEAAEFLYGGGSISLSSLADDIAESVGQNDRARERGQKAYSDEITVSATMSRWINYVSEDDLAAAVRHYGDIGHPDGTECERTEAAKWCHERGPGKDSPDSAVWAAALCNLQAGHAEPHSFESAAVVGADHG